MSLTVKIGTTTLECVREVGRSRRLSRDSFVENDGEGAPFTSWTVTGYVRGSATEIVVDQANLEDALANEGDSLVEIIDNNGNQITSFQGRVTEINWQPYHTGPLAFYDITIESDSRSNPFAGAIVIGSLTLDSPCPAFVETYKVVNEDDPMSKTYSRSFRLTGRKVSDPAGVETFIATLENAVTSGASNGYFTLTTPMGVFNARATGMEINRPEETDTQAPVTFTIDIETKADYSLESFNLPHSQISVAGIIWDVVTSFSHNVTRVQVGTTSTYRITSESMRGDSHRQSAPVHCVDQREPEHDSCTEHERRNGQETASHRRKH